MTMTTRQTWTKAILMGEPFTLTIHVSKHAHPMQDGLVGEGQRPRTGRTKMTAMLGGTAVGAVVGSELATSEGMRINAKP